MDYIHFWQMPHNTGIMFDSDFRRRFIQDSLKCFGSSNKVGAFLCEGKSYFSSKAKFKGSLIRQIKCAKPGSKYEYFRVWVIMKLARRIGYSKEEIEKHIVGYRGPIGCKVAGNLPVKVTPEFTSLLAHMMGDGTDRRTCCGCGTYSQYNTQGLLNFSNKVKNVFGEPERSIVFVKDNSVYMPKLFLIVIKKYFSIRSFATHESYVPKKIFYMNRAHRLAFLTAFLIDEGAFYDTVCFRVSNRRLAAGVRKVALTLGYKCSKNLVSHNTVGETYGFTISNYSAAKLLADIRALSQDLPTCGLAHKEKHLEYIAGLSRISCAKRLKGETKDLILRVIASQPKNTIQISKETGVCRRTVRCHLQDFLDSDTVHVAGQNPKGAKLWLAK